MLDPLTALSVAGSIIQIVDFGSRLFALTARTLESNGNLEANVDLGLVLNDLRVVSRKLERASTSTTPALVTQAAPTEHLPAERIGSTEYSQQHTTKTIDQQSTDERLRSLARRSHAISIRLLKVLESIKSKGNGKFPTWNALRQSLHTLLKKDEIDDYLKQLEPLRGELTLNLVDAMRYVQGVLLSKYIPCFLLSNTSATAGLLVCWELS